MFSLRRRIGNIENFILDSATITLKRTMLFLSLFLTINFFHEFSLVTQGVPALPLKLKYMLIFLGVLAAFSVKPRLTIFFALLFLLMGTVGFALGLVLFSEQFLFFALFFVSICLIQKLFNS